MLFHSACMLHPSSHGCGATGGGSASLRPSPLRRLALTMAVPPCCLPPLPPPLDFLAASACSRAAAARSSRQCSRMSAARVSWRSRVADATEPGRASIEGQTSLHVHRLQLNVARWQSWRQNASTTSKSHAARRASRTARCAPCPRARASLRQPPGRPQCCSAAGALRSRAQRRR